MNKKRNIGYYYRELKDLSFWEILGYMPAFLLAVFTVVLIIKTIILFHKIHITDVRWIQLMGER